MTATKTPQHGPEIGYRGWLLLGVWIIAPVLFLTELQVTYSFLSEGCERAVALPVYAAVALAAIAAAAIGAIAWREWRRQGAAWPDAAPGPAGMPSFIAIIGVSLSVQVLLILVVQALALAILSPCS
jgi:hypothetical protein